MQKRKEKTETKERKKNWREVYASVDDIKAFLADRIFLRHNVITGRVECRVPSSYETDGTDWQPISDRIVNSLWSELSQTNPTRIQDVYRIIESDFVPEYHPFRYWFSREEIARLSKHNEVFEATCHEKELIKERFRLPTAGETGEFVTATDILQAISNNPSLKLSSNKVGRAMTDLGFLRMRSHGERGYIVVAYSAEEIKARKRIKACDARLESEPNADEFDTFGTIY